ncbi:methyltransferase [Breznakiella homolactica]|uniref:Methyltransferase n=1 Tax=Breznakiella homolactica TaxID=2798577 RepID=A0A7T8BBR7_9SPIR|nr:methyltransferase [Breznakiella homolactica]QQO10862.1 methyltransferase [Breznakiella homolactica]
MKRINDPFIQAYGTKQVPFRFRGRDFRFDLSHGLFSSADIDTGTKFLLKVLSRQWDSDLREGRPLPRSVLDAGCGTGVMGICAAKVLAEEPRREAAEGPPFVRAQDRDELARGFTEANARLNGIPPSLLSAHTEPLLSGPPGISWDLIMSNIPAKAGTPILEDFAGRAAAMLSPNGRVLIVAVNPLAELFRSRIREESFTVYHDETGKDHTVFMYGRAGTAGARHGKTGTPPAETGFLSANPEYLRGRGEYRIEDISYRITAIHGVPDFDTPGSGVQTAAKLVTKLNIAKYFSLPGPASDNAILVHEPDQGHFPVWLSAYLGRGTEPGLRFVLSGRNILALEASRLNLRAASENFPAAAEEPALVPAADLLLARDRLLEILAGDIPGRPGAQRYGFIAAFPETVPRTDRFGACWEALESLLAPGGIAVLALPSTEADRFERKKIPGFTRMGDLKKHGFRALAYRRAAPEN